MQSSKNFAKKALITTIASAVIAWLIFIFGSYVQVLQSSGEAMYAYAEMVEADNTVYFFKYFTLLGLTVLIVGALTARKMLRRPGQPTTPLAKAADEFSFIVIIIGLVLAAFAILSVFLQGFALGLNTQAPLSRTLNTYLPIIAFTALIILGLLFGLVFVKPLPQPVEPQTPSSAKSSQSDLTMAWVLPILSVAIALILGLIIYDITQTSLEVWIWVLIMAIVAAGIVSGTFYAMRCLSGVRWAIHSLISTKPTDEVTGDQEITEQEITEQEITEQQRKHGLATGAQTLSFILSIIFSITLTLMSLAFGTSATNELLVNSNLSADVSNYDGKDEYKNDSTLLPREQIDLSFYGSGLKPGTSAKVSLEPAGTVLFEEEIKYSGSINLSKRVSAPLLDETQSFVFEATYYSGEEKAMKIYFETEDDKAIFRGDTGVYEYHAQTSKAPVTLEWFVKDLLPALALLLIAAGTIYLTLVTRNVAATPKQKRKALSES